MEGNPHHPATKEMHDLWHKIVAVLMHKFKQDKIEILSVDIVGLGERFPNDYPAVVFRSKDNVMTLELMSGSRAEILAAAEDPR